METEKQLDDVAGELRDRYGEPPQRCSTCCNTRPLKCCHSASEWRIERNREHVSVRFTDMPMSIRKPGALVARTIWKQVSLRREC